MWGHKKKKTIKGQGNRFKGYSNQMKKKKMMEMENKNVGFRSKRLVKNSNNNDFGL